jgi:hypothetical protein
MSTGPESESTSTWFAGCKDSSSFLPLPGVLPAVPLDKYHKVPVYILYKIYIEYV